jgi:hypothetical protein
METSSVEQSVIASQSSSQRFPHSLAAVIASQSWLYNCSLEYQTTIHVDCLQEAIVTYLRGLSGWCSFSPLS